MVWGTALGGMVVPGTTVAPGTKVAPGTATAPLQPQPLPQPPQLLHEPQLLHVSQQLAPHELQPQGSQQDVAQQLLQGLQAPQALPQELQPVRKPEKSPGRGPQSHGSIRQQPVALATNRLADNSVSLFIRASWGQPARGSRLRVTQHYIAVRDVQTKRVSFFPQCV